MKTFRIILLNVVVTSGLWAGWPRFYLTAQVGRYKADAGSVDAAGFYVPPGSTERMIDSGVSTFRDFSVGAEIYRWFSLEGGYVDFNSFSSPIMDSFPPGTESLAPLPQDILKYWLHAYRITPVVRVPLTQHVQISLLGGFNRSENKVRVTRIDRASSPYSYTEVTSMSLSRDSYHVGIGLDWEVTDNVVITARYAYYDFGRIPGLPKFVSLGSSPVTSPGNRLTASAYSLGISWRL
ncbi:MAG: outer membrane beta-barrel protein [Opitutaceae bacterium]|nr:outer membrane beta-barrel protein [Opitutaceae bacterium]